MPTTHAHPRSFGSLREGRFSPHPPGHVPRIPRPAFIALLGLVIALAPSEVNADLTYNIDNYPNLQSGFTLSGTLTTNATLGVISTTNFITWDITITGPGGPLELTPQTTVLTAVDLIATANTITLDPAQVNAFGRDTEFDLTTISTNGYSVFSSTRGPTTYGQTTYPNGWQASFPSPYEIASTQSTPVVPEPSTITIAAIGAVAFIAYGWYRRSRDPHRQGSMGGRPTRPSERPTRSKARSDSRTPIVRRPLLAHCCQRRT